ncbi:MAG: sensor histidine kinase N-terminal domain-containing protein [Methylomonas sp.]|uniref:sensor histidine kinase n=1 Tax=Methylomonas sp. TaxID=418 RepID=UPI0025CC2EE9|nr:sensor histidine kinase [Methylomonas sp.]MCK9606319.1 sensor histidine kinase N-terminal domain-containing protein [Methylomonas sp.]
MPKPRSLRAQLLSRLTLPLLLVVILDASVSYFVALHYADLAYDRWLLDSANSLVQQIKTQKNKLTLELSPSAIEVFRWDEIDKTFFKVESQTSGFIAGDKALPSPTFSLLKQHEPLFFDGTYQDKPVRIVAILTTPRQSTETVIISVAETLNKRRSMMSELFLAVVMPQVLLLFITGLHVWTGINRGLKPLHELVKRLSQRSARDLKPIPDSDLPFEVHLLTHTINSLLQKLAATVLSQQRFIENAAHQLRTPLAGLKVQAERALLAKDVNSMEPALQHIKNAADRVAHLSTQLLVLARSESVSMGGPEFSRLDLTDLARECCMDWVPRSLESDIELEFDAPPTAAFVIGDPTLLRELLNNLLDNAVRYGQSGSRIKVEVETQPQTLLIVEDNGPGIAPGEMEKVFERFYRVPGSPGEGCGLGLAIVKEIADLHQARAKIGASPTGRGTRVSILFNHAALKQS